MEMTKAKKKRPPRLERPKKQYDTSQCALYGIKGTLQLLRALKWEKSLGELEALAQERGAYSVWTEQDGRTIQAPTPKLRTVHARVAVLLRRIIPPHYRHSGIRDRSFITNAAEHLEAHASLKLDIKSFYPSTKFGHVRRFFIVQMNCAPDVAAILARLCCYQKRHVPTGAVHSEVLAFYCHKEMFDQLAERVRVRGGRMTIYVDDIMVTMPNASLTDLEWTRHLFSHYGMQMHPRKSSVLRRKQEKIITGVAIRDGRMFAPSVQHKKVEELLGEMRLASTDEVEKRKARSLIGHLDHIAHIDPRFKARASGNRARLKSLVTVS